MAVSTIADWSAVRFTPIAVPSHNAAMEPQKLDDIGGAFLLQTSIEDGDPVDAREVRQSIRRLGGVETEGGFAFRTAVQRAVVWEILG